MIRTWFLFYVRVWIWMTIKNLDPIVRLLGTMGTVAIEDCIANLVYMLFFLYKSSFNKNFNSFSTLKLNCRPSIEAMLFCVSSIKKNLQGAVITFPAWSMWSLHHLRIRTATLFMSLLQTTFTMDVLCRCCLDVLQHTATLWVNAHWVFSSRIPCMSWMVESWHLSGGWQKCGYNRS